MVWLFSFLRSSGCHLSSGPELLHPPFLGYCPSHHCCSHHVKRYTSVDLSPLFVFNQNSLAQVQVTVCKQVLPFEQHSLACFCSDSGHSWRPWRSRASKTHPFQVCYLTFLEVLVGWTISGTWLAGTTCPTTVFVGISMVWALKLHREIGTLEDPGCNSP